MRIVLTGASGFVGRSLAGELAARGHEILSLCRPGRDGPGTVIPWDMNGLETPPKPPGRIDAVAHLAQSRQYRNFPDDAAEMFRVNVCSTAALLDWALAAGADRFVLVSSGAVYEPFAGALQEEAAVAPNGYLGASKLAGEIVARPYGSKLALSILRVFFPYGPGQTERLMPDLIRRVLQGEPVQLAGGSGLAFTPTFVDDVAKVLATALEQGWTDTVNLAGREAATIREVAETIGRIVGKAPVFDIQDRPAPRVVPDVSRLSTRYDLAGFLSLADGLRRTIG